MEKGNRLKKKYFKNRIIKVIVGIVIALFVIAPKIQVNVVAESWENENTYYKDGMTIQVESGYNNIIRLGKNTSFYITITAGNKEVNGTIKLNVNDAFGKTVSYAKGVVVAVGEKKCVQISIPIVNEFPYYSVEIVEKNGEVIFEKTFSIEIRNDIQTIYIGTLTKNKKNLSYLKNSSNIVEDIDYTKIHNSVDDLNLFNVIVIDNYDVNEISKEKFDLLLEWVHQGGKIVLGTGEYYKETLQRFVDAKAIHTTIGEITKKYTLFGLSSNMLHKLIQDNTKLEQYARKYSGDPLSLKILDFEIEDGLTIRRETNSLVERSSYGDGEFIVFHTKLGSDEIKDSIFSIDISNIIAEQLKENSYNQMIESMSGNMNYDEIGTIKEGSEIDPISISSYIVLIVIYIIVIGPFLYCVLIKFNHQRLYWRLLFTVSFIFFAIVLLSGNKTRMIHMKSNYFSILYYDNHEVAEKSIFNVTVPYNQKYEINMGNNISLEAINNKDYIYTDQSNKKDLPKEMDSYQRQITQINGNTYLKLKDMTPYTSTYYKSTNQFQMSGKLNTKLSLSFQGFKGRIQNNIGYDLENAFLIGGSSIIYIGQINNNQTAVISSDGGDTMMSSDYCIMSDYVSLHITSQFCKSDYTEEIGAALNKVINEYFSSDRSKCYVIGFIHGEVKNSVAQRLSLNTEAEGLQIIMIPVDVSNTQGNLTYVPELGVNYRVLEGMDYNSQKYRTCTGTTVVEFQLPKKDKVHSFYYSNYNNYPYSTENYSGFSGDIYFYNLVTKQYDLVFDTYGQELFDVENYLSIDNKVVIKFQPSDNMSDSFMQLPYISYYKEAE